MNVTLRTVTHIHKQRPHLSLSTGSAAQSDCTSVDNNNKQGNKPL